MGTQVMGTEPSGNTRNRRLLLTLNQPERWDQLRDYIESLKKYRYGIASREFAPTTGHKHIHFYVCFTSGVKLSIKKSCGANIQVCYGTHQQCKDYVKKDGEVIYEYGNEQGGEEPHQGKMTVGKLRELPLTEVPWNMYNIAKKAKADIANVIDVRKKFKEVRVTYIWGPSGAGKSKLVDMEILLNANRYGYATNDLKYANGFWIGITENEDERPIIATYDDFRDSSMPANEFINFIDYRRHQMNTKGASVINNYEVIYITSVQDPTTLYRNLTERDSEPIKQWLRRCKVVHVDYDYFDDERENLFISLMRDAEDKL